MHRLSRLTALKPLLASNAQPSVAWAAALGELSVRCPVQSSTAAVSPALAFPAAADMRTFASGPYEPGSPSASAVEGRQNSSSSASTSQPEGDQSSGDWMEDWAKLLQNDDSVGQAEFLQKTFGEDPEPVGPPLHELLNYNRKEEERAKRRMSELQKQEQLRQSRQASLQKLLCSMLY